MNKRIFQLIAVGLISITSCSKEKLPKATQQGKNTFGCKIDGKIFLPSEEGSSWIGARPIIVSNSSFDGFMVFAVNFSSQLHSSVTLALPQLKKTGAYNLHTYGYGEYKLEYAGGQFTEQTTYILEHLKSAAVILLIKFIPALFLLPLLMIIQGKQ